MSYVTIRDGIVRGMDRCPHCGTGKPTLPVVHIIDEEENGRGQRRDLIGKERWHIAECTRCKSPVCLYCMVLHDGEARARRIFPSGLVVDESVPDRAARFIRQAHETLASPDASVVMSASAVDAMLKDYNLKEGNLYDRIGKAVENGIITENMSKWVHLVRLEANKPRHADETVEPATAKDAKRSFEFAKALAEILYVLPSRMPEEDDTEA